MGPSWGRRWPSRLRQAFARGAGHGPLRLGAAAVGQVLPPSEEDLEALASAAPMMPGAEYVAPAALSPLWEAIGQAFVARQAESGETLQAFLKRLHPAWHVVGRVHFHLAKNRKDEEAPFAFRPA